MPLERAFFEKSYYAVVAPYIGSLIPRVYHYSRALYCIVMECLKPHVIQRREMIAGRRHPRSARDVAEYIARVGFFTSGLAGPFERKMDLMATFAKNQPPVRITVDLIFTDPCRTNRRNRWTTPQLDDLCADFHRDGPLKAAVAKFLSDAQALIHGDLHTGSVMVTPTDARRQTATSIQPASSLRPAIFPSSKGRGEPMSTPCSPICWASALAD
jgi:5-methylthioribose kinase